jgi:hypothetical protein
MSDRTAAPTARRQQPQRASEIDSGAADSSNCALSRNPLSSDDAINRSIEIPHFLPGISRADFPDYTNVSVEGGNIRSGASFGAIAV